MEDIMNTDTLKSARKNLRNHSTLAEATLWKLLKNQQVEGLKFRRQHSIGTYIIDFYCPQLRLAIELDGEVHTMQAEYDERRSLFLKEEKGIHVLRFENRVVLENPIVIIEEIKEIMLKQKG